MSFTARDGAVIVNGVTDEDSFDEFKAVLDAHPETTTIVLNKVPGSDDDDTNLRMAEFIRSKGLATHLTSQSVIESGGIELFFGGARRTMERGARIGVHTWTDDDEGYEGRDLPKSHPDHKVYLNAYRELGAPESLYWFILRAAPEDAMYFLNEEEIARFHVLTAPIAPGSHASKVHQVTGLVVEPNDDDDDDDSDDS